MAVDCGMPALLDFRHVTVSRGGSRNASVPALDDVSLRIEQGEHVCILGPNGCGKSTLIKTITRELYPLQKEETFVSILGRERWDIFELRNLLGVVSPDALACDAGEVTGRDIVISGFFSSVRVFPHHHPLTEHIRLAEEALSRLGIAHLGARPLAQMSSGEAKRTLIARALAHKPETLLLDEPSNALDIAAQFRLRDKLRDLAKSGLAIVLVTHHVSEIIPEIERVILLKAGRIVADGPKNAILTTRNLTELFGVPVEVTSRDGYFDIS
jgi:iron complex transport system ATP-binding protein